MCSCFIAKPDRLLPDDYGAGLMAAPVIYGISSVYQEGSGHVEMDAVMEILRDGCIVVSGLSDAVRLRSVVNPYKLGDAYRQTGVTEGMWNDDLVSGCLEKLPRHLVDSALVPPGEEPEKVPPKKDKEMDDWCRKYVEGI